jgi:hypothetical protein
MIGIRSGWVFPNPPVNVMTIRAKAKSNDLTHILPPWSGVRLNSIMAFRCKARGHRVITLEYRRLLQKAHSPLGKSAGQARRLQAHSAPGGLARLTQSAASSPPGIEGCQEIVLAAT